MVPRVFSGALPHSDVRFGSLADIRTRPSHVRFTPESRHPRLRHWGPL